MLFSYSQFKNIKSKIVEDFNTIPVQYFSLADDENDDRKDKFTSLLNRMRTNNRKKKQRVSTLRKNKMKGLEQKQQSSVIKSKLTQFSTNNHTKQNSKNMNFYITQALFENVQNLKKDGQQQNTQSTEVEDLREKQKEGKMKQKDLLYEINEMQRSIRYFKKQITEVENKLKLASLHEDKVDGKVQLQKINTNKIQKYTSQIKYGARNTINHFEKSLKNLKTSMEQQRKKGEDLIDELCENLLIYNKKKEKIGKQHCQIKQLQTENRDLHEERKSYEELISKSQMLMKAFNVMSDFKSNQENLNLSTREQQLSGQKILKICEKLSSFLKRMRENQDKLRKKCFMKINQKEELQQNLKALNENIVRDFSQVIYKTFIYKESIEEAQQSTLLRKKQNSLKKISTACISFVERILYFVKKQTIIMNYLVGNWLKNDISACQFLSQLELQFEKVIIGESEPIQELQIKNCIIQHFEKWEQYLFFQQSLTKSGFISGYMTKNILLRYIKKIIKTKVNKINLPTKQLFMSAIRQINNKSHKYWFEKTKKLLSISQTIYEHTSKFQVLIPNLKEIKTENKHGQDSQIQKKKETKNHIPIIERQSQEKFEIQMKQTLLKETASAKRSFHLHDMILTYQEELNAVTRWNKLNKKT